MMDYSQSREFCVEEGYSRALLDAALHRAQNWHSPTLLRWAPNDKPEGEDWLVAADPEDMQYPKLLGMNGKYRFFVVLDVPSKGPQASRYKLGGYVPNTDKFLYQILYEDAKWRLQKRKEPDSHVFHDLYINEQDNDVDPDAPPQCGWKPVTVAGAPQVLTLKFFSFKQWRTCEKFLPALHLPWEDVRECRVEVHKCARDFLKQLRRYFVIDYSTSRAYFRKLDKCSVIYEDAKGAVIGIGAPNEYHLSRTWKTCLYGIMQRQANTNDLATRRELANARKATKRGNSENVQKFFASLVAYPGDVDALARNGLSQDNLDFFWDNVRFDPRQREWVLNLFFHVEWWMWAEGKMGNEQECNARRKLLYEIQQWLNDLWNKKERLSGDVPKLLTMIRGSRFLCDETCALQALHHKHCKVPSTRLFETVRRSEFYALRVFPPACPANDAVLPTEDARRATPVPQQEYLATGLPFTSPSTHGVPEGPCASLSRTVNSTNPTPSKSPPHPDDACRNEKDRVTIRPQQVRSHATALRRSTSPPMPPSNDADEDGNAIFPSARSLKPPASTPPLPPPDDVCSATKNSATMKPAELALPAVPVTRRDSPPMPPSDDVDDEDNAPSVEDVDMSPKLLPKPPPAKSQKPAPPKAPMQSSLPQRSIANGVHVPKSLTSGEDPSGPSLVSMRKAPPMSVKQQTGVAQPQVNAAAPFSAQPPPESVLRGDFSQHPSPPPKHPSAGGMVTPAPGMAVSAFGPLAQTALPEHNAPLLSGGSRSAITALAHDNNSHAQSGASGTVTGESHAEHSRGHVTPPLPDTRSAALCQSQARSPTLAKGSFSANAVSVPVSNMQAIPPPPPLAARPRPPLPMQRDNSVMSTRAPDNALPPERSTEFFSQSAHRCNAVHSPPAQRSSALPSADSCATPLSPTQSAGTMIVEGAKVQRTPLPPVQGFDGAPALLHPAGGVHPPVHVPPQPKPVSSPAPPCQPERTHHVADVAQTVPLRHRSGTAPSHTVVEAPLPVGVTGTIPPGVRPPPRSHSSGPGQPPYSSRPGPPPYDARPSPPPRPPALQNVVQHPPAACSTSGSTAPTTPESCRSVRPDRAQSNMFQCAGAKTPNDASFVRCFPLASPALENAHPIAPQQQSHLQHVQQRPQHPARLNQQQQFRLRQSQQLPQQHDMLPQHQHGAPPLQALRSQRQSPEPPLPQHMDDRTEEDLMNILFPTDAEWCAFPLIMRDALQKKLYSRTLEHYKAAFDHFMLLDVPTGHDDTRQKISMVPFPTDDEWLALPLSERNTWQKKLFCMSLPHYEDVFDHLMRLGTPEHVP